MEEGVGLLPGAKCVMLRVDTEREQAFRQRFMSAISAKGNSFHFVLGGGGGGGSIS